MLEQLHKKINSVCEINGLYFDEDQNKYVISYKEQPNEDQLGVIDDILASWPLELARINKINEIECWWKNVVKTGWKTSYGWSLGLDTQDVTLLTGAFMLSKEAAQLGIEQNISIVDTSGISHEFNLQDLTQLMLQYGNVRSELSKIYAEKIRLAKEAVVIEELEWITCP